VDPAHSVRAEFRLRNEQQSARRIDADHVDATIDEQQGECPCPATNVQNPPGTEVVNDLCVHIEIARSGSSAS